MILPGLVHLWNTVRSVSPNTRRFLLGTFLMGIGQGAVWVHLNLYFRTVGLGDAIIGQILSASSMGVVLVSLPSAIWVDRFRAERIFLFAAVGFGVTLLGTLFFPQPQILLATSFLSGMCFTIHWVAAAPFYMRNAKEEHRTELFGISSALETFATVLSAVSVGALARILSTYFESELLGLRSALVLAAVVSLTAVIPFAGIRSSPFAEKRRQWRDYVYSRNMGLILKLAVPGFLIGCGAGLTIPFLNLYFRDRFHQDPAQITTPLGGWLIERHGYGTNMFLTIGFYLIAASLFWTFFRGRVVAPQTPVTLVPAGDERD